VRNAKSTHPLWLYQRKHRWFSIPELVNGMSRPVDPHSHAATGGIPYSIAVAEVFGQRHRLLITGSSERNLRLETFSLHHRINQRESRRRRLDGSYVEIPFLDQTRGAAALPSTQRCPPGSSNNSSPSFPASASGCAARPHSMRVVEQVIMTGDATDLLAEGRRYRVERADLRPFTVDVLRAGPASRNVVDRTIASHGLVPRAGRLRRAW
jgi:hypothetical protein